MASLNIRTGRVGVLDTTLQAFHQGNVDVGFIQEKKLTQGIHTRHGAGYNVLVMEVEIRHKGGVSVVLRAAKGWQVENTANCGPNLVSLLLTSVARRWYVVGSYVPPNNRPIVNCVEQVLRADPEELELILMGYLNARLGEPHVEREEDLAMALED